MSTTYFSPHGPRQFGDGRTFGSAARLLGAIASAALVTLSVAASSGAAGAPAYMVDGYSGGSPDQDLFFSPGVDSTVADYSLAGPRSNVAGDGPTGELAAAESPDAMSVLTPAERAALPPR
ncbi:MAG: hypothetical protein ACKOWF_05845 [Chloroflexota bacterium]